MTPAPIKYDLGDGVELTDNAEVSIWCLVLNGKIKSWSFDDGKIWNGATDWRQDIYLQAKAIIKAHERMCE